MVLYQFGDNTWNKGITRKKWIIRPIGFGLFSELSLQEFS